MINDEIRKKFGEIKIKGERQAKTSDEKLSSDLSVIGYMNYLLENMNADDVRDIGFCLWNISDSYALLRDGERLYENHKKFADFLSRKPDIYKFWTVSDTTQRFTLISCGFGDLWQELYREAAENSEVTEENYRAAYEAHRAALSVHPSLKIPEEHLIYAEKKFSEFISNNKNVREYDFYKLIYLSSVMKAFGQTDIDIESVCAGFFNGLSLDDTPSGFVCGEWEHLNRVRSEKNRADVGIKAAVNTLIDTGEKRRAAEVYRAAKEHGMSGNVYIDKRLI